jgi:hypothetical protein
MIDFKELGQGGEIWELFASSKEYFTSKKNSI